MTQHHAPTERTCLENTLPCKLASASKAAHLFGNIKLLQKMKKLRTVEPLTPSLARMLCTLACFVRKASLEAAPSEQQQHRLRGFYFGYHQVLLREAN